MIEKQTLDNFILSYCVGVINSPYSERNQYGCVFNVDGKKVDFCINHHLGARLIISDSNGACVDVPLHSGTFYLAPKEIVIEEITVNHQEQNYLNLLDKILTTGNERKDRTGVGTKSLFGETLRFDLTDGTFPLLTTKKIFWKGVMEELLFFIRGETNTKLLEEKGVNIWKGNTSREFLDSRGLQHLMIGDMGKGYGWQWRRFGGELPLITDDGKKYYRVKEKGVDQLSEILRLLKEDPTSRRIFMSAWNPQQLDETPLPPCHTSYQMWVNLETKELSASFNMRSVDAFLGLPFNIASYATLTHMMAKAAGLTAKELVFTGGDVHIYLNHVEAVRTQLKRAPHAFPTLKIEKEISTIADMEDMKFEDFVVSGYQPYPAIKAEMAV